MENKFNKTIFAHGSEWRLLKVEKQEKAYNENYNLPHYVCVYKGEQVGIYIPEISFRCYYG